MCKHRNGELIEVMDATHSRELSNGELDAIGYNEVEDIRFYLFRCFDCHREWRFYPNTRLRWLRAIYDQLRAPELHV